MVDSRWDLQYGFFSQAFFAQLWQFVEAGFFILRYFRNAAAFCSVKVLHLVNDKGSPNPQGFWRVGVGVGVRGRNFLPSKIPYPCGGYESDQI